MNREEYDEEGLPGAEVALWRAVIDRAISDYKAETGGRGERRRFRDDAESWLFRPNRDFHLVCELALLEPDAVREGILKNFSTDRKGSNDGRNDE